MPTRAFAGVDDEVGTGRPSTLPAPSRTPAAATDAVPTLTLPELAVGMLVLGLAIVAWMSLLLADNHNHSLPAVIVCSVLVLALLGLVSWVFGGRIRVRVDPWMLLVLAALGVVAGYFFFPGFHYAVTDKDPGVYVAHAIQISRGGSYSFHDAVMQRIPDVALASPGARFPGIWIGDPATQTIVPQFYHLWPALLATAFDVHGWEALTSVGPLVGMVAVLALAVTLCRAFNPLVSIVGGLLLATNMLEVWQAKYPTTEILAQLLYLGTLLGIVLAVRTGWRPAAGFAGILLGIGWLCRPDTVILIVLAIGVGATLVALRRFEARCWWFLGGFAVVAPHALWQAYAGAAAYTAANALPSLPKLAGICVGLLATGLLFRFTAAPTTERVTRLLTARRFQSRTGFAVCSVAAVLLVVGMLRPRLFGASYTNYNGRIIRSFDEHSLIWLSWFITVPGLMLMGGGLAVIALRRWRTAEWALALPAVAIMPVYGYRMRNSPRLIWATRRWVPIVLPGIVLLIAVAIVFAVTWGYRTRTRLLAAAGLAALGLLLAAYVSQSAPLRDHDEFDGSYQLTKQIAALAGSHEGVFLFAPDGPDPGGPTQLFGAAMWLERDQHSALIPSTSADHSSYVRQFLTAFPDEPVFVVSEGTLPPAGLPAVQLIPVLREAYAFPLWQESTSHRPSHETRLTNYLTVWQVPDERSPVGITGARRGSG